MLFALLVAATICPAVADAAKAPDWPGFRGGPARASTSTETGLAPDWQTAKPRLVWESYDVGSGHGSAACVDGVLYLLGGNEVRAIDSSNGICIWRVPAATGNEKPRGGSSTPAVRNGRVYTQATGLLLCHDAVTGKQIWGKDILQAIPDVGSWTGGMKYGDWHGSPLLLDDKVVVLAGHQKAILVAFRTEDGSVAWRAERLKAAYGRGWSSPLLAHCNGRGIVITHTQGHLMGVNPADGKVFWEEQIKTSGHYPLANIPVVADNLLFCTARYNKLTWSTFKLSDGGRKIERAQWNNVAIRPYQESAIHVNGMLFGYGLISWADIRSNPEMLINGGPLSRLKPHLAPPGTTRTRKREVKQTDDMVDPPPADEGGAPPIRFKTPREKLPKEFQGGALVCQDLKTGKVLGVRFGFAAHSFWGLVLSVAAERIYAVPASAPQRVYLIEPTPAMTLHGELRFPKPDPARRKKEKYWFDTPFATPTVHNGLLFVRWHDRITAFDVRAEDRAAIEDAASLQRLPGLLAKWLADPGHDARRKLLKNWLAIRDRATVATLTLEAYDKAPAAVRPRALRLAARTRSAPARAAIIKAVDSSDTALADTAAELLADAAQPDHLPKFLAMLSSTSRVRAQHGLRGALAALAKPTAGTPAKRLAKLRTVYESVKSVKDKASVVRMAARLPVPPSFEWCRSLLESKSGPVRTAAASAVVAMAPRVFEKQPVKTVLLVEQITKQFAGDTALSSASKKSHRELMALAKKRGLLTKIIRASTGDDDDDDLGLDL